MFEYCFKHQALRPACEQCAQCAVETAQVCDVCKRPVSLGGICCGWPNGAFVPQRDALNILEARQADQDAAISGLIRQLGELRNTVFDLQRVHNHGVS